MMATPWLPRETRGVAAAGIGCLVLLAVCWYRASGEGHTSDQMPWLDLGAAGVALYWILAGRVVARARRRVAARRELQFAALAQPRWGRTGAPVSAGSSDAFVRAPGMSLAHRPQCPLVAGKPTEPAPVGAASCGICG